ncbi:DNA-deoxyinosine glycosylase [Candidatus Rariloculus sp.]|uniref:DNA-deoxyinosine glycosylase n=1 Tax=Candidatus Rariloculus sp. TaxID=3101265 RepID=UPI003D0C80DE
MTGQAQRAASFSRGFPPVYSPGARILILGSLPGARSLEAREYYAQPQNAFWRIMGALYGSGPELAYEARLARLTEHAVALWDVLAAGQRPGSLDSAIVRPTAVTNDFASFFERNPSLRSICFNGATAAELYRRKVLPALDSRFAAIPRRTLPSTSPAHARMRFAEKLAHWSAALTPARDTGADQT